VLQQPDHLVPVPRALLQQLEQVQPKPRVAKHRTHDSSPPGRGSPRSSVTSPDTVVTSTEAMPPPSRPLTDRAPGYPSQRSPSKPVVMAPTAERSSTSVSTSAGSRTTTGPDSLCSVTCPVGVRARSAVIRADTVSARSRRGVPAATVSSPATLVNDRSPVSARLSTAPDTVSVLISPLTPSSTTSPVTLRTLVRFSNP